MLSKKKNYSSTWTKNAAILLVASVFLFNYVLTTVQCRYFFSQPVQEDLLASTLELEDISGEKVSIPTSACESFPGTQPGSSSPDSEGRENPQPCFSCVTAHSLALTAYSADLTKVELALNRIWIGEANLLFSTSKHTAYAPRGPPIVLS